MTGYSGGVNVGFDKPYDTLPTVIVTTNLARGSIQGPFRSVDFPFNGCIENKLETFVYSEDTETFPGKVVRKAATPKCVVASTTLEGCYVKCGMLISDVYNFEDLGLGDFMSTFPFLSKS